VGGELGADVLEDAVEDAAAVGLGVVARVRTFVGDVGLVDGNLGPGFGRRGPGSSWPQANLFAATASGRRWS